MATPTSGAPPAPVPAPSPAANHDDHRQGLNAETPLSLLLVGGLALVAWIIFNTLQITSTEQSVFGLLSISVAVTPGMTVAQVMQTVNGQLDKSWTIAAGIGWGVQIALLILAFPDDRPLLRIHKKYASKLDTSPSITASALRRAKMKRLILFVLVGLDVLTDFMYVVSGHTLASGLILGIIPVPTMSGFGVFIVGLMYPTALCFVTVFCAKQWTVRLEALVDQLRGK